MVKKIIPLLIVIFCLFLLFCSCNRRNWHEKEIYPYAPHMNCEQFWGAFGHYWKKDSIGEYQFRMLAINEILRRCDIKGESWNLYSLRFGKAQYTYHYEDESVYWYNLTNYGRYSPGQVVLAITIDKKTNAITNYRVIIQDG